MVKNALRKIAGFSVGIAVGAAAGAAIGYLGAPSSGDDLRKDGQELIDSARHAGERARIDRETELRDKFRDQVGNQSALSAPIDESALATEHPPTSLIAPA